MWPWSTKTAISGTGLFIISSSFRKYQNIIFDYIYIYI